MSSHTASLRIRSESLTLRHRCQLAMQSRSASFSYVQGGKGDSARLAHESVADPCDKYSRRVVKDMTNLDYHVLIALARGPLYGFAIAEAVVEESSGTLT